MTPTIHRELLISGPAASITADTEAAAAADQIGLSSGDRRAARTPAARGRRSLEGRLLRSAPVLAVVPVVTEEHVRDRSDAACCRRRSEGICSTATIAPEHRLITVAFVQFSGTDDLLLSAGPTVLADALDEVVRNVQHACADHDVTFFETDINRDGGKIMLTAGAPRSADHDEERMLRVARVVLDRAGRLPLRIGINRGHVFSGDFGPSFRRTYSVKGDAINLAARVMGKAAPGQALATLGGRGAVTDRVPHHGAPAVPGQGQDRAGACSRDRGPGRPTLATTCTRRRWSGERRRWRCWAMLSTGREPGAERLVEIVGDAGIGKSRLVSELLTGVD